MTYSISDYIRTRLIRLGIDLSDVELFALQIKHMGTNSLSDALSRENVNASDVAIVSYIRDILLMPDMSEGGYSLKFDRESVIKWYNLEVQRLGLGSNPNYTLAAKIRDASNRW